MLHQVDKREAVSISEAKRVPNKEYRVSGYMNSNGMKGIMTGHERDTGAIDPKASLHGLGSIPAKDVWAPKAY